MSKISISPATLLNPVPVVMVSCAGKDPTKLETRPNILTVAWTGTINSEPPMVSISVRKTRHSHSLICQTQEFVINLVSEDLAKSCDFCGVRGGERYDKFAEMKLHPVSIENLRYAPAIQEAPVSMGCIVKDVIELGSHDMFLAEVVSVSVDSSLMDTSGKICMEKAGLVTYCHGEYFSIGKCLGFFGYSVASKEALKRRMPSKNGKKNSRQIKDKPGKKDSKKGKKKS